MGGISTKDLDNFSISVTYNDPPNDGKRRYVEELPAYRWEEGFMSNEQQIIEYMEKSFHEVLPDHGEYIAMKIKGLGIEYPSKFIVRASPFKNGITCNGSNLDLSKEVILENAVRIVSNLEDIYGCGKYLLQRKAELDFNPPRSLGSEGIRVGLLGGPLQSYGYTPESLELYGEGSASKRHSAKFNYYDYRFIPAFDEHGALGSKCAGIKIGFNRVEVGI